MLANLAMFTFKQHEADDLGLCVLMQQQVQQQGQYDFLTRSLKTELGPVKSSVRNNLLVDQ